MRQPVSSLLTLRCTPARTVAFVVICLSALDLLGAGSVRAQELQLQNSPYSAYLDLRPAPPNAPSQTVPDWIEAFEFMPRNGKGGASFPAKTNAAAGAETTGARARSVFRIRVQRPRNATDDLQVRVFFDDRSLEARPVVAAWDELGTELMRSSPLGQGLGIASSETVTIPMSGVNYLEVETSDDGSQVRGVFFTWLEKAQIRQPIDFPTTEKTAEPFRIISATRERVNDACLYGAVTASLQRQPVALNAAEPAANIQFELERQPLVAIVTYEVLGANINAPPLLHSNSRSLGPLDFALPDLADPAYQGQARSGESDLGFHYTGWIRAQKVIPGQLLVAGLNELSLELSNGADSIAIRSVEIQLKYNWEKLDYVLAPALHSPAR